MNNYNFNPDIDLMVDIARRNGCKTIKAMAEKLDMNRNLVGKIVNGKELPSSTFMYRFVEKFNVQPKKAGLIFFKNNLPIA